MNQNQIQFSDIQNLVQSRDQRSGRLECVFVCPVSGTSVRSAVDIVEANGAALKTKAGSRLRGEAARSLSRGAARTLRSWFGNNVIGRLANEIATDKGKEVEAAVRFTEEELERATVVAFESVAGQFAFRDAHGGFVHRSVCEESA